MIDILSQQINGALSNAIFNQVRNLGLNLPNPILVGVVSRVAEELSVYTSRTVTNQTNFNLTNIPNNLLGTKNPVNLVTGNLGSVGVSNNLSNILLTQASGQISNQLIVLLTRELSGVLPQNVLGVINLTGLVGTVVQLVTPTINTSINTVLKGVTDSIFNRNLSNPSLIPSNPALYSTSQANRYLNNARNFDVNNKDNQEKLIVTKKGFTDPSANYPTKEYAGQSETNKLARGEIKGTIVQEKNLDRMKAAQLPNGQSWEQPESPYKGEYPYNKVTQTEGGHIIEMDDTPGAERIHLYHKSGTFVEIDVNGSVVMRAKGSKYEIIDRNGKLAITGQADISINGACNIYVGSDANIEVNGDTNLTCHNDITAQAFNKFNLAAPNEFNITSNVVNIQALQEMNLKANVAFNIHSSNVIHMHSNAAIQVQAVNWYSKTSQSFYNQSAGAVNFKSTGNFNVDGENVYINSGNAQDSKDSYIAKNSNIGINLDPNRITSQNEPVSDPIILTLADPLALRLEEEPAASGEYKGHRDNVLTSGFATASEFDATPVVITTDSITSLQSTTLSASNDLLKVVELPGNYNLSPSFTVEMLSTKASLTKEKIVGDESLPYGKIIYNLQAVALNILEPAYNLYPSLVITSGYRSKTISSKNSLHPQGKCCLLYTSPSPRD